MRGAQVDSVSRFVRAWLLGASLLVVSGLGTPGSAYANDSAAGLDGGVLVLRRADGIVMESEELMLSMNQVTVRYRFRNATAQDIVTVVAFPLPPMVPPDQLEAAGANVTYDPQLDNPLRFALSVEGQAVPFQTERKNSLEGLLLSHYWTQTFPAAKTITVEHSYRPALWQSYARKPSADDISKYCIDRGTKGAIKGIASQDEHRLYFASVLQYIVKTARNWHGPIERFTLTVDKGDPQNVVSLCISGLRKVSPTRFVVSKRNFVPDQDLAALFVTTRDRVQ